MDPFTHNKHESVASLGEENLLFRIRDWLGDVSPSEPFGIGDDCAVLPPNFPKGNLITVDGLFFNWHFDKSVSPKDAGAKLLKRNLSDLAAMGGTPSCGVLAIIQPENTRLDWLKDFYYGLAETAREWGVNIIGGDLSQSHDTLGGYLTLFGHAERPMTRKGAVEHDHLFVTGTLGGSLLSKHITFQPRIVEGQWLANQASVRSMIDLTDGIMKDLPSLLPANHRAGIKINALPISNDTKEASRQSGKKEVEHVLNDGEDYELLFTVAANTDIISFADEWSRAFDTPLSRIGRILGRDKSGSSNRIIDLESDHPISTGTGFTWY